MLYNKVDGKTSKHTFKIYEISNSGEHYNLFISAYKNDGFSARLWSQMFSLRPTFYFKQQILKLQTQNHIQLLSSFKNLLEELECGVAPDLVLLGHLALLRGVQLAKHHRWALLCQQASSLRILGSQGLNKKWLSTIRHYKYLYRSILKQSTTSREHRFVSTSKSVSRIRDTLRRIRILLFSSEAFKTLTKIRFFAYNCLKVHLQHSSKIKSLSNNIFPGLWKGWILEARKLTDPTPEHWPKYNLTSGYLKDRITAVWENKLQIKQSNLAHRNHPEIPPQRLRGRNVNALFT